MASQPTPPNRKFTVRAYENHWFPVIRPAIKPLFLRGVNAARGAVGWLTIRSTPQTLSEPRHHPHGHLLVPLEARSGFVFCWSLLGGSSQDL